MKDISKTATLACLGLLALALACRPAPAQTPETGGEAAGLAQRESLSDDWFGLGEQLGQVGLSVGLAGGYVYQQNVHGGLSTHRRAGRHSLRYDLEVEADLEAMLGLRGASIFFLAQGGASDGIDEAAVGSLYGVNSAPSGDRSIDVCELYYAQSLLDDVLTLQIGKIDRL